MFSLSRHLRQNFAKLLAEEICKFASVQKKEFDAQSKHALEKNILEVSLDSFSLKDIMKILKDKYLFRRKEGYCGPNRSTNCS